MTAPTIIYEHTPDPQNRALPDERPLLFQPIVALMLESVEMATVVQQIYYTKFG